MYGMSKLLQSKPDGFASSLKEGAFDKKDKVSLLMTKSSPFGRAGIAKQ